MDIPLGPEAAFSIEATRKFFQRVIRQARDIANMRHKDIRARASEGGREGGGGGVKERRGEFSTERT
jgi:hypothetical protein